MKLYQTHNGNILELRPLKEIGATADGWKRHIGDHPRQHDIVDVVLRNGTRHENTQASNFYWTLDDSEGDVVAFRIVPCNMQLEVGGIYKARSGSIHGPLKRTVSETYPFSDEKFSWTHSGNIFAIGDRPEPLDLVEKIAVVPADTASEWLSWGEDGKPPIHADSLVEIVSASGKMWIGTEAQRFNQWSWSSHIVAYRVVRPAKPTSTFSLEVGGIYKSRGGDIHGPLKVSGRSETYNFCDATRSWTPAGAYYLPQPEHARDLVEKIAVVPIATTNEWFAWNQPNKPSLPDDTIVEVVTRSGVVRAGPGHAQRVDQWFWASYDSAPQPHPILAYRVVPIALSIQESAPPAKPALSIEERLARLEYRLLP